MRLLVLDSSKVTYHLVRRLVPADVEVVYSSSFGETLGLIERQEADAVIADVSRGDLPWTSFQDLCCHQQPRIPVLFQSSVASRVEDSPLGALCAAHLFVPKPCRSTLLKARLDLLLSCARGAASTPPAGPLPHRD